MNLNLINPKNGSEGILWLPCEEKQIARICGNLETENNGSATVLIDSVMHDDRLNGILTGKEVNLDELNFFLKLYDGMSESEKKTLIAVADGKKIETTRELINLSSNTNCYHLIDDFSDLHNLGKSLYLNQEGGIAMSVLEKFDGQKYVEQIISGNKNPIFSKYGVVYPNENEAHDIYLTKCFPSFWYKPNPITLRLETNTDREYLYLPFEQSELQKSLERLGVDNLSEINVELEDYDLPIKVAEILLAEIDIEKLNDFAKLIKEQGLSDNIEGLIESISIENMQDLKILIDSQYEFDFYSNVYSPLEYGEYMIKESGRFEFDENLEEYIDFEKFAEQRITNEKGVFTNCGYLAYQGYNKDMQLLLYEKLGMDLKEDYMPQELKLYMPLTATTYDEENSWGVYEKQDFEIELDSYEIAAFEDEINDFIEEYDSDLGERGLMEYYDKKDSINAKVKSYRISVESINHELMGVMTLQLNAPLTEKELEAFIESETGQMSDGWAEGFEQRDIKCDGRDINISFWNSSDNWEIRTAEEFDIRIILPIGIIVITYR